MQPVTILFYNEFWPSVAETLSDCPWPCRLLFEPSALPEADVVVFHIPTLRGVMAIDDRLGQLWVAWSMESDINYPCLANAAFMQQFDLTMTYRRDSDIWVPYFGPDILALLWAPPQDKTASAPAVYLASNPWDRSGRNQYAAELMKHLPVDSYGRCLRNRTLPGDEGRRTKLDTIASYPFTLAFENSISKDYVTEKFFDPLLVGSVPVYLGAPNVNEFAPGNHAFIDVNELKGPAHLADYLRFLSTHPEQYAEYLAWKQLPLRKSFIDLVEAVAINPISRLVDLVVRRRRHA